MLRALVTGATGFIGGHLVRALASNGWEVHAIFRETPPKGPAQVHRIDGTQQRLIEILNEVQPDVVFHLASLFLADHTPDQIEPLLTSNVVFPTQLVEAMRTSGCRRLVNTGTGWQFGPGGDPSAVNLYAASKQAFDAILKYYSDAHDLSVLSLRLFDTYGQDDPRRKLIGILLEAVGSSTPLDMSPGEQVVDMTHISDVVDAFVVAGERLMRAEEPIEEAWFVSGERQTVRELVDTVCQAVGRQIDVNFGGRAYRPREVMFPADPTDQLLPGWHRKTSLAESLPTMVSF